MNKGASSGFRGDHVFRVTALLFATAGGRCRLLAVGSCVTGMADRWGDSHGTLPAG